MGARILAVLCMLAVLITAGCGGGDGGNGKGGAAVGGVVAAGAPLVGTVNLKDSSNPAKEVTAAIADDGSFSFSVDGLTPPFLLKATGTAGGTSQTLYSFANGAGTANVTPLSSMALSISSGGFDPATIYNTPSAGMLLTIASKLPAAVTEIQAELQPLLAMYDAGKVNPLTDTIIPNHTGMDEVLDMVKVDVTAGTVTVRNKATNAVILTCQANALKDGALNVSAIPVPPVRPVISPIAATVVEGKTVTFTADVLRSNDKKVTWAVVEAGGGTITDSGLYTAPTTEGTYHVKAVSHADSTWPATAVIKVVSGQPVNVAITPASQTVSINGTVSFTATVTGASNSKVAWSVVEGSGGTISSSGLYTAPATTGTFHVKATSIADSTKNATATVTVTSAPEPTPTSTPTGAFPIGTWVGPNGISFTVTNLVSGGIANQYAGSVTYSGGAINVSGTDPMNQILCGSDMVSFAVSKIFPTSGVVISFSSISTSPYATELTGPLSVQSTPPAPTDYMNLNATFHKK